MVIKLPDIRSDYTGFSQLAALAAQTRECAFERIDVDMAATNWIDAHMCAPLGVIFTRLLEKLNVVRPVGMSQKVESILRKNLFLGSYGFEAASDEYGTTIPYRRFKPEDGRYFVSYINKHLDGKGIPSMSDGLSRKFKDSLLEVFTNCGVHSETELGVFACGQFYPQQNRVDFCIADAGIGIRKKIRKELDLTMNSDTAILWALEEGNTTRKGSVPGGLGLKLLREFVSFNGGRLQIISDRGFWECTGANETVTRFEHSFPGTVVNLEINTADPQTYCLRSELPPDTLA